MAEEEIFLTFEGRHKLEEELEYLRTVRRAEVAERIGSAKEEGDISENAEYDAAKDAQGMLEMKIAKLEEKLANARVLNENNVDTSKVSILTKVKILNLQNNKEFNYTIVAEEEAHLPSGKISVTSPIGKGLLGKKVGEEAMIEVPSGKLKFSEVEGTLNAEDISFVALFTLAYGGIPIMCESRNIIFSIMKIIGTERITENFIKSVNVLTSFKYD